MSDPDFAAILGPIMGQREEPATLTEEQQVIRLRDAFEKLGDKHEFKPGDLVIHRFREAADVRFGELPGIVLRMTEPKTGYELATQIADVSNSYWYRTYDMIVMQVVDDCFRQYLVPSEDYEPFTLEAE